MSEMFCFLNNGRKLIIEKNHDSLICLLSGDSSSIGRNNEKIVYSSRKEDFIEYSDIFDHFGGNYDPLLFNTEIIHG